MGDMADLDDWCPCDAEPECVTVSGVVKHTTEKAILLDRGAGHGEVWLPKSQIDDQDWDHLLGESVEVEVPGWLAREKGWEE